MQQLSTATVALASLAGTLLLCVGIALVRLRWLRRQAGARLALLGGWLLVGVGFASFGYAWGGELGTAYALLAFPAAAYAVVAAGLQVRPARQRSVRELALEPEERRTNWPRAAAKSFLAIVLAGIASIGIGVAFAVAMPLDTQDRIVLGGLLVPILWGGGMAWTLSDAKLLRATLLLTAISAAAYAIAFLPKVLFP